MVGEIEDVCVDCGVVDPGVGRGVRDAEVEVLDDSKTFGRDMGCGIETLIYD